MFDFNKCRPIELDDLVRIGNDYDCGYVLSQSQIEKTDTILSFGVRDDWTFEEDFVQKKASTSTSTPIQVYSYDYSTKDLPFVTKKFGGTMAAMLYHFFRLKRSKVLAHFNQFALSKKFYRFFDAKQGRHFIPKFIGQFDDERYVCFETIFKELGDVGDQSVFVKMDIEGGEYLCLPQLVPFLRKVNGMVIEFHILDIADEKFEWLLDEFSKEFYVGHVHGNNFGGCIYGTDIPSTLEMTFISKRLVLGAAVPSSRSYPIEGLDAPCDRSKEDCRLVFTTQKGTDT